MKAAGNKLTGKGAPRAFRKDSSVGISILIAAAGLAALSPVSAQDAPPIKAKPITPPAAGNTPAPPQEEMLQYADLLYSHNQFDVAARQYRIFLSEHPKSPNAEAAWFRLGECYLKESQIDEAKKSFSYVVQTYQKGTFVGSAAYRLAAMEFNGKNYEAALPFFEIAQRELTNPEIKLQANFYYARCLQLLEKKDIALVVYQEVAAIEGENALREPALLEVARLLLDLGQPEKSFKAYSELAGISNDPDVRAEALAKSGLLAAELGKSKESNEYLEMVMKLEEPGPWLGLVQVGLVYNHYTAGEYPEIIAIYENGLQGVPDASKPRVLLLVGHAYRAEGKYEEALGVYDEVEKQYRNQSEGAEAGFRKLQCYHLKGDAGLPVYAAHYIEEQSEANPDSHFLDMALLMKAEFHFAKEQWAEAADAYSKVRPTKIDQEYHAIRLYKLGWAQTETANRQEGIVTLSQFLEEYGDSDLAGSALAKRASTYQVLGDFGNAITDFKKVANDYPNGESAEYALQQIALMHAQERDIPAMIAAYEDLLKKFPKTSGAAEAHYWIGSGHFDQKEYEAAIEPLSFARKENPEGYEEKASLRIILALYQMAKVNDLAKEATRYLGTEHTIEIPQQVFTFLGVRLYERGDYKQAAFFLGKSATPEEPARTKTPMWDMLGKSRLYSGDYKGALEAFQIYIRLTEHPTLRARAYVAEGYAHLGAKQYEEADTAAKEALRLQKQGRVNGIARELLGDLYSAKKEYDQAATQYLIISQIFADPTLTPRALFKAAKAYEAAGDRAKAQEQLTLLQQHFPNFKTEDAGDPYTNLKETQSDTPLRLDPPTEVNPEAEATPAPAPAPKAKPAADNGGATAEKAPPENASPVPTPAPTATGPEE